MPYEDGYPIPDGYHPEKQIRTGLLIGGAVTFGVMYTLPALVAASIEDKSLFVPIAGPFIELGHLGTGSNGATGVGALILITDGLAQAAGVAMLIAGTQKKNVLVRDDVAGAALRVAPMGMGYGGMGIGIVGTM